MSTAIDPYSADYMRALTYRNSPEYAWQQQLASGANLAKNLNAQTLLGLTLGTGIGHWLGDKFYNWQRAGDDARQYPPEPLTTNPAAINSAVRDALFPQGDANLGWSPQYQFPTANKLFTGRVTPNPSNFSWRQNNRQRQPFFPMTPTTPQVSATPTTATPQIPAPSTPNYINPNWTISYNYR